MLKTFTLKNGIKVATYSLPQLKSVFVTVVNKSGSLVEDPTKNGVAHFMEHMLVQGIPSYPTAEALSEFVEGLAGTYGASTSATLVTFSMSVPAIHLEDSLRIASETWFEPLFVTDAIEKERRAVFDEITQRADSTGYRLSRFFRDVRFTKGSPLLTEVGGTMATVSQLNRDDMLDYWRQFFIPKNTYLLISGKFDTTQLDELLEKYFAKYTQAKTFSGYPNLSNQDFSDRTVALRPDSQLQAVYFDLSVPSIPIESPIQQRLAQSIATIALGRLRHSRLFKLLRYQRGLVYDISVGTSLMPGLGLMHINGECLPAHLDEVLELIAAELKVYLADGPTKTEFDFVKNYLSNQWLMSFDHPSAIADWIEGDLLWRGTDEILLPEELIAKLNQIKLPDVQAFMQKYWDFAKLNVVIQGAIEETPAMRQKVKAIFKDV